MPRLLRETAGGLPRTFWAIFAALLVNRVGAFGMLLLPTYLMSERGTSLALAGLVTGAYGAGGGVGSLLGGVLADRWGRRQSFLAGTAAAAGLMLALAFAKPVWLIATLVVLLGAAHTLPGPPMIAAIVDVVPGKDRSRAFNLHFWAFNMGTSVAAALAGLIAQVSFPALFIGDAAMTALTAVLVWFFVPETKPLRFSNSGGLGVVLRDRVYLTFVALTFVLAFLTVQSSTTIQLAMAADGLSPVVFGFVLSVSGAMIVLGQLFVPRLIGARRHAVVLACALTLVGIGYVTIAFANVAWFYLAAAVVWTSGQMLAAPANASINAELSPVEMRGRYQAIFNLVFPAAFFAAPAIGGWSLERLGVWHWVLCGMLGLGAAAGHLASARTREQQAVARELAYQS